MSSANQNKLMVRVESSDDQPALLQRLQDTDPITADTFSESSVEKR
jgi:hypothetical protein